MRKNLLGTLICIVLCACMLLSAGAGLAAGAPDAKLMSLWSSQSADLNDDAEDKDADDKDAEEEDKDVEDKDADDAENVEDESSAEGDLLRYLPTYIVMGDGSVTVEGYFINLNEDCMIRNFTDLEMAIYMDGELVLYSEFGDMPDVEVEPLGMTYYTFTFTDEESTGDERILCDESVQAYFGCGFSMESR